MKFILGILDMPGITLEKTSMFICMQKTNFIIHFFRKILQLRESYRLIGWQHFGSYLETENFVRYGDEIPITMLVFIIDYFQEKLT